MNNDEARYLQQLKEILDHGIDCKDRTGTGTKSLFGGQLKFSLTNGTLPVITTKKVHLPSVIHELLWFISGDTNIQYLKDNNVRIWDEWADENGNLGPVYGVQWRTWTAPPYHSGDLGYQLVDQLQNAIRLLKTDPDSRRIIVNAWNVAELDDMALAPCHMMFQFKSYEVDDIRVLSCHMYQRSADFFLGVPFNITSYALLTHMIARITNHVPLELVISFGDMHLYKNHLEQAEEQYSRPPMNFPKVRFTGTQLTVDDFQYEDIHVDNYEHHPAIKGKVSV